MYYVSACSFAAAETGVQKEQTVQEKQLTTKEKEQYLKGRRSRTIQQSIDKCKTEIPYDVQISLHYNYLKSIG